MAALYPDADCNCKRRRASRSFEFEERRLVGGRGFDNQQAEVHRLGDQVRAVAGIEFEAHILDMSLDGARRDMDLERALLGGAAGGYKFQNLMLAIGQLRFDVQSFMKIGSASCREGVCPYVEILVVAAYLK